MLFFYDNIDHKTFSFRGRGKCLYNLVSTSVKIFCVTDTLSETTIHKSLPVWSSSKKK